MGRRRFGRWKRRLALSAVVLFVLQTSVVALALGETANAAERDIFGNVACSVDLRGQPSSHRAHRALLRCCTLGCVMFAPMAPAPEGGPSEFGVRDLPVHAALPQRELVLVARRLAYAGTPRAPPAFA